MQVRRASAIALDLGVGAGLGGCNQVFGLDAPRALDAADDGDAGDPVDAGGDGAPPSNVAAIYGGSIDVVSPQGSVLGYEAYAVFGPVEDCTLLVSAGGCRVDRCTPRMPAEPVPGGGVVTIEGTRLVDLVPDAVTGRYPPLAGTDGVLFVPGTATAVYSTGGVVPAFAVKLVSPEIIRFTQPNLPSPTTRVLVSRAVDLALAWEPAGSGEVIVLFTDAESRRLTCQFPANLGQASVPATALGELAAGDGSLLTYTMVSDVFRAGDFDVIVRVGQAARRADNDAARGTLGLQ